MSPLEPYPVVSHLSNAASACSRRTEPNDGWEVDIRGRATDQPVNEGIVLPTNEGIVLPPALAMELRSGSRLGCAFVASSSAIVSNKEPAAGSAIFRTGSWGPPVHLKHPPSDYPGGLIHKYASRSGTSVTAVVAIPVPRPGGLHHSCGSPAGWLAGAVHGPRPLRPESITKCAVAVTAPRLVSYQASESAQLEKSFALAGQYLLAHNS